MSAMTRTEAVEFLHQRHPSVVDSADGHEVDLETLHGDVVWFQMHVCEKVRGRAERAVRRCLATVQSLLLEGDRDVRRAIDDHFFVPHLSFSPDFLWIQSLMEPPLRDAYDKARHSVGASGR